MIYKIETAACSQRLSWHGWINSSIGEPQQITSMHHRDQPFLASDPKTGFAPGFSGWSDWSQQTLGDKWRQFVEVPPWNRKCQSCKKGLSKGARFSPLVMVWWGLLYNEWTKASVSASFKLHSKDPVLNSSSLLLVAEELWISVSYKSENITHILLTFQAKYFSHSPHMQQLLNQPWKGEFSSHHTIIHRLKQLAVGEGQFAKLAQQAT